jgi:hypothetical protein
MTRLIRISAGMLRDRLTRSGLRHHMRSEVPPRRKPSSRAIANCPSASLIFTPSGPGQRQLRRNAGAPPRPRANRAEQSLGALTLLF